MVWASADKTGEHQTQGCHGECCKELARVWLHLRRSLYLLQLPVAGVGPFRASAIRQLIRNTPPSGRPYETVTPGEVPDSTTGGGSHFGAELPSCMAEKRDQNDDGDGYTDHQK